MPFDAAGFTTNSIIPILIEGRRRVEASHFCGVPGQGVPIDGHCLVLSISRQNVGEMTDWALRALARTVYGSEDTTGLQPWNDCHTKEEALEVYDQTLAREMALCGLS